MLHEKDISMFHSGYSMAIDATLETLATGDNLVTVGNFHSFTCGQGVIQTSLLDGRVLYPLGHK